MKKAAADARREAALQARKAKTERIAAEKARADKERKELEAASGVIETIQPVQPPPGFKGMCGKCEQPILANQLWRKTLQGVYIHMADDKNDGCPNLQTVVAPGADALSRAKCDIEEEFDVSRV